MRVREARLRATVAVGTRRTRGAAADARGDRDSTCRGRQLPRRRARRQRDRAQRIRPELRSANPPLAGVRTITVARYRQSTTVISSGRAKAFPCERRRRGSAVLRRAVGRRVRPPRARDDEDVPARRSARVVCSRCRCPRHDASPITTPSTVATLRAAAGVAGVHVCAWTSSSSLTASRRSSAIAVAHPRPHPRRHSPQRPWNGHRREDGLDALRTR